MRLVIFEGTTEEFEAIRPLTEGELAEVGRAPAGAAVQDNDDLDAEPKEKRPPTYDEAISILRFRGNPSENQKRFLRVLFEREDRVHSSSIRDEHGWKNATFRGVRTNFSRRVRGALGREDVFWVHRKWDSDENENEYWLPNTVRQALKDELGW